MTIVADLSAAIGPLVGNRVVRNRADGLTNTDLPYVVVLPNISTFAALEGDNATRALRTLTQIDVWQASDAENDTLVPQIVAAVAGLKLTNPRMRAHIYSTGQIPEPPGVKLLHDQITVRWVTLV